MRLRIVACEIFFRELCHLAARSARKVDVEFLPKGLHDQGGGAMRERLQAAIDATDPGRHDAVALAYGLCNNGLVGLRARALPLVLLRAHDCITAFLGSRARYARYFDERPGTLDGDLGLLHRLVDGPWDSADFLVLQPGERAAATLGDEVIVAETPPFRTGDHGVSAVRTN